jgi:hypothetical protein
MRSRRSNPYEALTKEQCKEIGVPVGSLRHKTAGTYHCAGYQVTPIPPEVGPAAIKSEPKAEQVEA